MSAPAPQPRLSAQECAQLVASEGYLYLDVRSVPEFEQGHPHGAFNIPLQEPAEHGMRDNPQFLELAIATFAREQPLVVGCRSGNRSQTAAAQLLRAGFSHVVEQRAGFHGCRDPFGRVIERGWLALGLPCAAGPQPGRDYASLRGDGRRQASSQRSSAT
jgi:rhodanese-related sulfurtransferase